ncbi:MAG: AarF/UbiB family protein [Luminiphilus sp.]|nr:AarF/UbiB family protein [Luminiphilus sp.]
MLNTNPDRDTCETMRLPPPLENRGFLGGGGQGLAWLALDPKLNRMLVAKRFQARRSMSRGALLRLEATFAAQAKVAAMTSVVPQIYRVENFEGAVWLLLEFVEGVSLQRLQAAEKLTMGDSQILLIVMGLLKTLTALEASGLVHGDVAPGNILLNAQGQIRLIDFSSSVLRGTPRPARGAVGFVRDSGSTAKIAAFADDQYALGSMIYWLLAANLPVTTCDQYGQAVVTRAEKPEGCTGCANLLWESAAILTDRNKNRSGVLSSLAGRYRQQARLLPSESRSSLAARVGGKGCAAKAHLGDEPLIISQGATDQSALLDPKSVSKKMASVFAGCAQKEPGFAKAFALACLIALGGFAGFLSTSPVPYLTLGSVRVAANTALPSGFSHDWLSERLQRVLDERGVVLLAKQTFIAGLDCDHYTCVLSLDHQTNGADHAHQQTFTASAEPQVWESVISDLGRAVAAH